MFQKLISLIIFQVLNQGLMKKEKNVPVINLGGDFHIVHKLQVLESFQIPDWDTVIMNKASEEASLLLMQLLSRLFWKWKLMICTMFSNLHPCLFWIAQNNRKMIAWVFHI